MTLVSSLGHHPAVRPLGLLRRPARTPPPGSAPPGALAVPGTEGERVVDGRVFAVQMLGAGGVGSFLLLFGLLGATSGVPFLSTVGERFLGMSANGLLSALSLVVGAVLLGAALCGPRIASTAMVVLGGLFLLSAVVNLVVLSGSLNLLAFRMSNVVFSVVVGVLLLLLGAYGRFTGHLPDDSPYAHPHALVVDRPDAPRTPAEVAAEAAMREAEIAVVQHYATEDQRRRVRAMSLVHTREERRRIWMQFDSSRPTPVDGADQP